MKKTHSLILSAAIASLLAGPALAGPSAKFAATWTDTPSLAVVAEITSDSVTVSEGGDAVVMIDAYKTGHTLATIKVPQDKELLVGVSAEIGLVTFGSVKGKNGGSAKSLADASAHVTVYAVPKAGGPDSMAAPGPIMLSKRVQELGATLGGVIQSCTDGDTDGDGVPNVEPDGTINIATECVVTDEEISLLLDTTAAHHFNFVLPNMEQGEYDIKAVFTTGALAQVEICAGPAEYEPDPVTGEDVLVPGTCPQYDPEGTVSASARASAVINKTMLTVQEVRAAKGGVIDAVEITTPTTP